MTEETTMTEEKAAAARIARAKYLDRFNELCNEVAADVTLTFEQRCEVLKDIARIARANTR